MKKPPLKKFKKAPVLPKKKLPSKYRIFPEHNSLRQILLNKYFIVSFITAFIIVALTLQGISLRNSLSTLKSLETQKAKIDREVLYWEKVTTLHKEYRDGYFKLALLEYQRGDKEKSRIYIKKTLEIDPNFIQAKDFAKEVGLPYSP